MDIVGIGTEIVECLRIRRMIEEHGELFLLRVFSAEEISFCQARRQSTEHFAARWAAKEAVVKAIGLSGGHKDAWGEVAIQVEPGSPPRVAMTGNVQAKAHDRGIQRVLLTMSFCRAYATATAIAIGSG